LEILETKPMFFGDTISPTANIYSY